VLLVRPLSHGRSGHDTLCLGLGTMALRTGGRSSGAGLNMTEQLPEDLTEAEVADRREADHSEDEGDTVSEVDRWDDEGGHDRVG
jgi:hypothetical protein